MNKPATATTPAYASASNAAATATAAAATASRAVFSATKAAAAKDATDAAVAAAIKQELVDSIYPKSKIFMLGYVSADGSIRYRWDGTPDNLFVTYTGLCLYARDDYLLVWLRDQLNQYSITCTLGEGVVQGNHFNILAYLTNDLNDAQLLHGLQVLTDFGVMLDGKLSLILHLLQNDKRASASVSSPHQLSFHEYLGACYDPEDPDRVACVVGHSLFQ
ncbi:hypothetical protein MUCCIDRAFT_161288 [Mucor lusitanicus CBS 277.49]|uniref:Uncharacterized protein n=1 Tax=Mucor lusitanicus CBS 277.49 TaxID=747725 RepID=A0A162MRD5_MUCCL|nr:hypothetical protein MUCCIDRAFT_161288 [Mucor lusitanicus CBS 277.49]